MNIYKLTPVLFLSILIYSCTTAQEEPNQSKDPEPTTESSSHSETDASTHQVNVDSLVNFIDTRRETIESNTGEPLVITTESLREKIKQKWQTMHFYTMDNELIRIKTYTYEEITNRTEEYYLDNGGLVLVVIEDNQDAERGTPKDQLDKMYYFHEGKLVREHHPEHETEYNLRESDGEEFLTELNEYLEIYRSHK